MTNPFIAIKGLFVLMSRYRPNLFLRHKLGTVGRILSFALLVVIVASGSALAEAETPANKQVEINSSINNAVTVVRVQYPGLEEAKGPGLYFQKLLILALQKTKDDYGAFRVEPKGVDVSKQRLRSMLISKQGVDVIWSTSNKRREKILRAVKFPLLKGLNEYRALYIRSSDQHLFSQVKNLKDFRNFIAGSGTHWHDTLVMEANSIDVRVALKYDSLLKMLTLKRFDYIGRGLYELGDEEELKTTMGIDLEQDLLLHYPAPYYFFVNKEDKALAKRILKGLKKAEKDGSLDALFFSLPNYQKGYSILNKGDRKILELSPVK